MHSLALISVSVQQPPTAAKRHKCNMLHLQTPRPVKSSDQQTTTQMLLKWEINVVFFFQLSISFKSGLKTAGKIENKNNNYKL